jgi:hypothetical protein
MARFNLDDYIDVAERIESFYEKYPNGRLLTELLNIANWDGRQTQFIVKSYAYDGDVLLATGLAEESFGNSGPNQTSALENAETSSLGRCLANLNFATTRSGQRQRPSRQEMEKVQRGPIPEAQAQFREKLAAKFPEMTDRKVWIEETVGREVSGISDLTEDDIRVLMALL